MIKYIDKYALFLMLVFCTSCGGQNKPDLPKENIKPETKDIVTSTGSNETYHTKYEYTDSICKSLIIQNGFPKGGIKYTDSNGEVYVYAIFWTRIINETDNPLELKIHFPVDSYEVPSLPGKYYKILLPPDTMTLDKQLLFDHGVTDLKSFLDSSIHKSSSMKRTINPKESSGFYVVILSKHGSGGALRTGLSLKGRNLFYKISAYNNSTPELPLIYNKEILCGSINLKNLVLKK
jgi:hypothetical protein